MSKADPKLLGVVQDYATSVRYAVDYCLQRIDQGHGLPSDTPIDSYVEQALVAYMHNRTDDQRNEVYLTAEDQIAGRHDDYQA